MLYAAVVSHIFHPSFVKLASRNLHQNSILGPISQCFFRIILRNLCRFPICPCWCCFVLVSLVKTGDMGTGDGSPHTLGSNGPCVCCPREVVCSTMLQVKFPSWWCTGHLQYRANHQKPKVTFFSWIKNKPETTSMYFWGTISRFQFCMYIYTPQLLTLWHNFHIVWHVILCDTKCPWIQLDLPAMDTCLVSYHMR